VHYAVKANPHPHLVGELVRAGGRFDVASPAELDLCLQAGADVSQVIYSHPMKRRADIVYARRHGVELFVADSAAEIDKVAEAAPGAAVLVRLATTGAGSDWPLSGKFGCPATEVVRLLMRGSARGLRAAGVTFHVGSQQCDPGAWACGRGCWTSEAACRPGTRADSPGSRRTGKPSSARLMIISALGIRG
jgi:ornithine decarboxylase